MQSLSFKCNKQLAKQLNKECVKRKIAKSDLVRRALTYYLTHKGLATQKSTLYDLSKDLCGTLNGPSDLSENPKSF